MSDALSSGYAIDGEAVAYYSTHPVDFVMEQVIAGRTHDNGTPFLPDKEQKKALGLLAQGKWPVIRAGRGVGKTAWLAWIIIWWIYCHTSAKIIVTSVKAAQLEVNLWPEIKRWLTGCPLEGDFEWQKSKVYLKGREQESFAVMQTGAVAESLQGAHDPYLLIVIEEASGVEDAAFDALLGSLTQEHNAMVMVGNPTRSSGSFYHVTKNPTGRFTPMRIPALYDDGSLHPNVTREFIDVSEKKYGRESNFFRVYVQGLFPKHDEDSVIPWEWVNEAKEFEVPPSKDYVVVWGVDPAITGDRTCICKRRGPVVSEAIIEWRGLETMQVAGRITQMYRDTDKRDRPVDICVDTIGVGRGVYDRLIENGLPARDVAVSRVPSSKERFHRLRDELWWLGREWFETRNVSIPDDDDLLKELTTPRYDTKGSGKIRVESKQEFAKRIEASSPDKADAFLLTFASGGLDIVEDREDDPYYGADGESDGVSWVGAW